MKSLVFVDIETTGRNPLKHQMYEFFAVPVINGVIRTDLQLLLWINHKSYMIESEIMGMVASRLAVGPTPRHRMVNGAEGWAKEFMRWTRETFIQEVMPLTLAGHNVGGFDRQFMIQAYNSLRYLDSIFNWGTLETGSLYAWPDDTQIPSLRVQRERAMLRGAPITKESTHYAEDDGLLAAELYCWHAFDEIRYYGQSGDPKADAA